MELIHILVANFLYMCFHASSATSTAASSCVPATPTQYIINPGFEDSTQQPWKIRGNASVEPNTGYLSNKALKTYISKAPKYEFGRAYPNVTLSQRLHNLSLNKNTLYVLRVWSAVTQGLPQAKEKPNHKYREFGYFCKLFIEIGPDSYITTLYDTYSENGTVPYRLYEIYSVITSYYREPTRNANMTMYVYCYATGNLTYDGTFTGVEILLDDITLTTQPATCAFALKIFSTDMYFNNTYIDYIVENDIQTINQRSDAGTFYLDAYQNLNRILQDFGSGELYHLNLVTQSAYDSGYFGIVSNGDNVNGTIPLTNCTISPTLELKCGLQLPGLPVFDRFYYCVNLSGAKESCHPMSGLLIGSEDAVNCGCAEVTLQAVYD